LYGRENLGGGLGVWGFWHFFLKNPSKLKNFLKKGVLTPNHPPPEYAPGDYRRFCYSIKHL